MFVEPVLSPIWAWLVSTAEIPGTWTLAGGAVILATAGLRGWARARRPAARHILRRSSLLSQRAEARRARAAPP